MVSRSTWGKIKLTPAHRRAIAKAAKKQAKSLKKRKHKKPKPEKVTPLKPEVITTFTGVKMDKSKYLKYQRYLLSEKWRLTRERIFSIRGRKCERCFSTKNLQVHHRHYQHLFHELDEDLEILCSGCHAEEHDIKKCT